MEIGGVLGEAWSLYKRFLGRFFITAFIVFAVLETVNDVRDGRADRSVGETYSAVRPRLAAATVAGILAAIGIGIGLILLIVPGLYLLTIWSMLIPVIDRKST